jgi:hypothetical protein
MKKYPWGKTKPRNFQDDTAQSIYIIGWLLAEPFFPPNTAPLQNLFHANSKESLHIQKRKRTISFPNEQIYFNQ